jgi:hypothetical protein
MTAGDTHFVSGDVKAACVSRAGKVKRIPAEIVAKLE